MNLFDIYFLNLIKGNLENIFEFQKIEILYN